MTTETIEGTVTQVNPWKGKPGYFAHIDTMQSDLYGYTAPKIEEGKRYAFTLKQGTKNFSAKYEVVNVVLLAELLDSPQTTEPKPGPENTQSRTPPKGNLTGTDIRIARSVALKAANELVCATIEEKTPFTAKGHYPEVVQIAREYEKYILD